MKKRVADIIFEILLKNGIDTCFCVVGGGAMHLDNALARNKGINKYFNHHEQACAMAAESFARCKGKMAAVCVTSGPGATNAITGVVGAFQDSLPMIVISGQVRYETSVAKTGLNLRYRGIQEFDSISVAKSFTKYAEAIVDPLDTLAKVEKAIYEAQSGRRGPAWIEVPLDVQSAIVDTNELRHFEKEEDSKGQNIDYDSFREMLKEAKRPCLLTGSALRSSGVMEDFLEFADAIKIPIIGGAWVADSMYREYPMFIGLSGNIGPRAGNFVLQTADLIIAVGNSLGFRQTGFAQSEFAKKAKIVMVDIDENEAAKPGLNIDLFIKTDLKLFFEEFVGSTIELNPDVDKWISHCKEIKAHFSPFEGAREIDPKERVNSYYFWKEFEKYEPSDSVLALGNNTANTAKLQIGVKKKDQRVITNYACGSMGYDLPAAIGAAIACKKRVVCVTGDGSIMMNLQELQTIKHYGLPISIVVFSNDGYAAIRQTCKNFFDGEYIGCTKDTGISFPEFESVAGTFGFKYVHCKNNGEVDSCLEKLFATEENILLEIDQMFDNPVIPKVMSRVDENGKFVTPALQDMFPFLSEEEMEKWMKVE